MDFTKVGKNINKLMLKSGMSMMEFGWVIGYPSSTICRWVNGNAIPKSKALYIISKRFGVTVDSLFDGVDEKVADRYGVDSSEAGILSGAMKLLIIELGIVEAEEGD